MSILDESLENAIQRLRKQKTDDADYEAKACRSRISSDVWDSVSAFANTSGGTLLLGIDETNSFSVVPEFNVNKVRDQFIEGIGDGGATGAKLSLPPEYSLERTSLDGKQFLAIRIHENSADKKPCYVTAKGVEGGSYKRVDDKDIRLSAAEIYEYQNALRPSTADLELVKDADLTDLDDNIIKNILARRKDSKALRGTSNNQERLSRLNITNKQEAVRMTGILVAGKYPQQFFPRLIIDVAVHPGVQKAQPGMPRFLDRAECDGPMAEMVNDAVNAVARNLRTYSIVEGTGRRDELEIPREVLREAIANAVIHREYHPYFQGQPVSVDVFPDRVTVTSPGGLWGGKTLLNIGDGESKCRNTALIQLMQAAPLSGSSNVTVEGQGTGIMFMIREMEARALSRPDFEANPDQFKVTLWRSGIEISSNRRWLHEHAGRELSRQEDAILLVAKENNLVSVPEIRQQLGYDSDDIRAVANKLVSDGLLISVGKDTFAIADENDQRLGNGEDIAVSQPIVMEDKDLLELIPENGAITTRELAKRTGKSVETIRRMIRRLSQNGDIVSIGKQQSRQRKYTRAQQSN
ncbi:ATP-binding protein [Bifidobacterium felsineum]|uniref:Transcriptional regulator n=1 Tax=Bifidobacterium felsineum TaxID=2045440 RepID=A0A2M9HLE2_9BIFI|nr:ATP-binding protein [Bifidobacterium felsineum]MBT1163133.1 putative DNA binding domain-containing protein [Bifidobacterium felsineum]PJM77624.1 transcriptional regulator [Bifidobacterium felsineum]